MNYRDPDDKSDYQLPSRVESFESEIPEKFDNSTSKKSFYSLSFKILKYISLIGTILYFIFVSQKILTHLDKISNTLDEINSVINKNINFQNR